MNIIPSLWLRLHFLVPDPDCRTFADDLDRLVWNDARTQPTEAQILAVTRAQMDSVKPGTARQTLRTSGAAKLKTAAGLTDAEVRALNLE